MLIKYWQRAAEIRFKYQKKIQLAVDTHVCGDVHGGWRTSSSRTLRSRTRSKE